MVEPTAKSTLELKRRALDVLARREHSSSQLRLKLQRMTLSEGPADERDIEFVLQELEASGALDVWRFCEQMVRDRCRRGFGELDIRARLQQAGVSREVIDEVLQESGLDGDEMAYQALCRRFGAPDTDGIDISDPDETAESAQVDYAELRREQGRQARFLQQRGFTVEQSRRAGQRRQRGHDTEDLHST